MTDFSQVLNLVTEYFLLKDGALIDNHKESLLIFGIDNSIQNHPHKNHCVYITRRALKHVVERRRKDLQKRHSAKQILDMIIFAIEAIPETIKNFDLYEFESASNNHFYIKDYSNIGMPILKILLEKDRLGSLYIKSIHFSKRTKKHHD